MNTAKQSLQQADQALHAYKRDAAMLTAARCILSMILTLIGTVIQRALLQNEILQYDAMMQPISHWNWFLPIVPAISIRGAMGRACIIALLTTKWVFCGAIAYAGRTSMTDS